MDKSKTIQYQGEDYYDDRLFVLYLCKGKVEIDSNDGVVATTIYHEQAPEDHIWCVASYRNCNRYPLYRIDSFYKKEAAEAYIRAVEQETPLISLGGKSPELPLSYEAYVEWKSVNGLKEYDWKSLYSKDGKNASERILQTIGQFKGIK